MKQIDQNQCFAVYLSIQTTYSEANKKLKRQCSVYWLLQFTWLAAHRQFLEENLQICIHKYFSWSIFAVAGKQYIP